jgi:pantothenate synthetase
MDQVQVLSAVCKKLNNDIEVLANQTSMRESVLAKLDSNQQAYDEQFRQLNMDLQIKLSKTDTVVQKLQSDVEQMSHGVRDVMNSQQDTNRSNIQRYQELKLEVKKTKFVFYFKKIFFSIDFNIKSTC